MRRWIWRVLLAVAVMAALTVGAAAVSVGDTVSDDNYTFTLKAGNVWEVTKYIGPGQSADIPDKFRGYPVTSIGPTAFAQNKKLTKVSIPNSITSIGTSAFYGTGLTSVTIPPTMVSIGAHAFENCSAMTSLTFLDNVNSANIPATIAPITEIGESAFAFCSGLTKLELSGSVKSVGESAFSNCTNLGSIIVLNGTEKIEDKAFYMCSKVTTVAIASEITNTMSKDTFDYTKLKVIHYYGDTYPGQLPDGWTQEDNIHKLETNRTVNPADCENNGYVEEPISCTKSCKIPHTVRRTVPAGHDFSNTGKWTVTNQPDNPKDCQDRHTTYERTCVKCGITKTEVETAKAIKPHEPVAVSEADQEKPENIKSEEPATCGADGSKTVVTERCNICGIELKTETKTIPATGLHDKANEDKARVTLKEPTCSTDGLEEVTVTCKDCGTVVRVVEKKLPATGKHEWAEPDFVVTKEPTCTEKGEKVKKQFCKNCETENTEYNKDQDPETAEVDPLGHDLEPETETITKQPTCTEPGKKTIHARKCLRDGCDYEEKEKTDVEISATGHDFKDFGEEIVKKATCQSEGLKKVAKRVCSRCKAEENGGTVPIPKTPHNWGNPQPTTTDKDGNPVEDVPPKCGEPGKAYVTVSCQNKFDDGKTCGAIDYQIIPIPATGVHEYGEWTTTKQPTATEEGEESRTCTLCGHMDKRAISPTGTPSDPNDPSKPGEPSTPEDTEFKVQLVPSSNGTFSASKSAAKKGETITVTYTPSSGYILDMIRVIGGSALVSYTDLGNGQFRFTMPASDVEIRVTFDRPESDFSENWSDGFGNGSGNRSDPRRTTDVVPVQSEGHSVPKADALEQVFQDIPTGYWAAGEINWASDMGYMSGTNGRFDPEKPISHQQMWMVLARLTGANPASMAEARKWAARGGFADGSSPTGAVKRHQLVTALYRCARLTGSVSRNNTSLAGYTDSTAVPARAREAFSWALTSGVISGDADGRLNPAKVLTRAEFAVILYCYSQRA